MKIGILGSGQLAMMLAQAAQKLEVSTEVFQGNLSDVSALRDFCDRVDRITYENENIPTKPLRASLKSRKQCFPSLEILEIVSDRQSQKTFLQELQIPIAPMAAISQEEEVQSKALAIGLPGIFKSSRFGYDGKGQLRVKSPDELSQVWKGLGEVPLVYEKLIEFKRELSLVACRNTKGECVFYPLVENSHREGILRKTLAPAPLCSPALQELAQSFAYKIFKAWDYEGILALELFEVGETLLVNEVASRVHNTGHWTLDGAETSQFENHLRAGLNWTLRSTKPLGLTAMFNLIGELPDLEEIKRRVPNSAVYLYGKDPRPLRKLGHINLNSSSESELESKTKQLEILLALKGPEEPV